MPSITSLGSASLSLPGKMRLERSPTRYPVSLSLLSVTREHNVKCRNKQAGLPVPGYPPHWPQLSPQLPKVAAQRGSGACRCPAMVTTPGFSRKKRSPTHESHPMERPHTAT